MIIQNGQGLTAKFFFFKYQNIIYYSCLAVREPLSSSYRWHTLSSSVCESRVNSCEEVTSQMHTETMIQRVTIFHQRAVFYMACDVIFHTTCQAFHGKLQSQSKPRLPLGLLMKNSFRDGLS